VTAASRAGGDTVVAFDIGMGDTQRLQIGADGLQGAEAPVDGGIAGCAVEVCEAALPLVVVFIKAAREFVKDELHVGIHDFATALESSEVLVGRGRIQVRKSDTNCSKSNRVGRAWKRGSKGTCQRTRFE